MQSARLALFSDLDLSDAKADALQKSARLLLRASSKRVPDAGPDPAALVSPCDAIIAPAETCDDVACCSQSFPYTLASLLDGSGVGRAISRGTYVTLRLTRVCITVSMAPYDCRVEQSLHIGDTWNVNPIALKARRAAVLQERARLIRCRLLPSGTRSTLVR